MATNSRQCNECGYFAYHDQDEDVCYRCVEKLAAAAAYDEYRRDPKPGDINFKPVSEAQASLHRHARKKINFGNGMV